MTNGGSGSGSNRKARHGEIFDQVNELKRVSERLVDLKNEIIGEKRNPTDSKIDAPTPPLGVFLETTSEELGKITESISFTIDQIRTAIF